MVAIIPCARVAICKEKNTITRGGAAPDPYFVVEKNPPAVYNDSF
jgi:hypothetical protein